MRSLTLKAQVEAKKLALPPDDIARLKELTNEMEKLARSLAAGELEKSLREFESAPWKNAKDPLSRARLLERVHLYVSDNFGKLVSAARKERLAKLAESWPPLPAVRLQKVNLITDTEDKTFATVAKFFAGRRAKGAKGKAADAKKELAARALIRQLRSLAGRYKTYQRDIPLAFAKELADGVVLFSPQPPQQKPRSQEATSQLIHEMLRSRQTLYSTEARLLQTWMAYAAARLELYRNLGLASE